MIIGLGVDVVELSRIRGSLERFGFSFLRKILHESETERLPTPLTVLSPGNVAFVAARFAAKEAGVKALGCGFSGGIGFCDLRVSSLPSGKPELSFHGKALELANSMKARAHLSLSHGRETAVAVVVLELEEQ